MDKRTASLTHKLARDKMSLTQQTSLRNLPKEQPVKPANQTARASTAQIPPPRMVRLTVSLPGELVDRLRNAVYWSPGLTLAWLIAKSLRTSLAEMESLRQGPFPQRTTALRAGRPRLVGQIMSVPLRSGLAGNGAVRPAEALTKAKRESQPSIE